jgi:hypothetical protein
VTDTNPDGSEGRRRRSGKEKAAGSHRLCITWVSRRRRKELWATTPFACATYQFRNSNRTQLGVDTLNGSFTGSVLRWVGKE